MYGAVEEMLKENGVEEYDKYVPNRILQVALKLIEDSLVNANELAEHCGRAEISKEDVLFDNKLNATACDNARIDQQEMLENYANLNAKPLPRVDDNIGLTLPSENTLTNVNYQLKSLMQERYVTINVPSRSGSYKIPLQIYSSSSKNRHRLEFVRIVERRANQKRQQRGVGDRTRKVLFTRRNTQ